MQLTLKLLRTDQLRHECDNDLIQKNYTFVCDVPQGETSKLKENFTAL